MALHYDLTNVDRSKWPESGIPLYDFCVMMMVTGVGHLKTDADMEKMRTRALLMDSIKCFGWRYHNKLEGQLDMIDLIPLCKGITTNVSNETTAWFVKRLKEFGLK